MTFWVPTIYAVTFGTEPADQANRRLRNPQRLLRPAPVPITNARIPTRPGRVPLENLPEESAPFELIWDLDGRTDEEGERFDDDREGLLYAVEQFIGDIYRQERTDGAVSVSMSAGLLGLGYQGLIQFADLDFSDGLWACEARIACVMPDGELERVAST